MRASVVLLYNTEDLRQAILANAPPDTQLTLYRAHDPPATLQLAATVRIRDAARDRDAASWIPYTTSYTAGDDLVLFLDHQTLTDILVTAAIETLGANGFRVPDPEAATVSISNSEPVARVELPLDRLHAPTRSPAFTALS